MSRNILVTGARGQLGWEVCRAFAPLGRVIGVDAERLNMADVDSIREVIDQSAPHLIINCAAYTDVDAAESEPEKAHAINGLAPGVIAEAAQRQGAVLVHYSSDYIFDGSGVTPWREQDRVAPLNVYGRSKAEGERAIAAAGARHLIFRTSWLYGLRGRNFLLTVRRLARERQDLTIVDDQVGAPTWCRHLAQASALAVAQIHSPSRGAERPEPWGLYHLCNAGQVSWHGFAQAILELNPPSQPVNLNPIASSNYPSLAQRPLNSRLDNGKFQRVFGCALPDWREALRECLDASGHEVSP